MVSKGHNFLKYPKTIWFTGLPCSGKTTLAKSFKEELENRIYRTIHLDSDDIRRNLNSDLGFSEKDRHENLRRIAHVARLFMDNGNYVIASFLSPTIGMRSMVRRIIREINFVYLDCSLKECERRDVKGMYLKARDGKIENFTGYSATYEIPSNPDFVLNTERDDLETCIKKLKDYFRL